MRVWFVSLVLLVAAVSGCADSADRSDDPVESTDGMPSVDEVIHPMTATLDVENLTVLSGVAFNVSLEILSGAPADEAPEDARGNETVAGNQTAEGNQTADEADDSNATSEPAFTPMWRLEVFVGNASQFPAPASEANETDEDAGDGNETAVGNATAEPGGNVTGTEPIVVLNGTGSSALVALNLTGNGTHVMRLTATADGHEAATAFLEFTLVNVTAVEPTGPVVVAVYENSGLNSAYALTNSPQTAAQCPGFLLGMDGQGCVFLELTEGPHDGATALMETDATNIRLAMWDTCSPTGTGTGFYGGVAGDTFEVAAGTGCIVAWSNHGNDAGETRTWKMSIYG